jgi:hypothetical protein
MRPNTEASMKCAFPVAMLVAILLAFPAMAQTKTTHKTLDAFAIWRSDAQIVPISVKTAVLAGTLGGPLYIETDDGPLDSGDVSCPATIEFNLQTAHQTGQGYCTFTANDGAKAFGNWHCAGTVGEGCAGDFTLTGGTGRLASVSGKSEIAFMASRHDLHIADRATLADKAGGITIWPGLNVTLRQALAPKK